MARAEKSVEIKAPPEKVWEMLALDRMTEWMRLEERHVHIGCSHSQGQVQIGYICSRD